MPGNMWMTSVDLARKSTKATVACLQEHDKSASDSFTLYDLRESKVVTAMVLIATVPAITILLLGLIKIQTLRRTNNWFMCYKSILLVVLSN